MTIVSLHVGFSTAFSCKVLLGEKHVNRFPTRRMSRTTCSSDQKRRSSGSDAEPSRRSLLTLGGSLAASALVVPRGEAKYVPMEAIKNQDFGKSRFIYPDYEQCASGLQYKDLREGSGESPSKGNTVIIDWDGYTIGYYGKVFEARNKAKGGSFTGNEKDYFRFKVGDNKVIPAFEEAIKTMRVGGIRRIIVPEQIGYPDNNMNAKGPSPQTFSGQRALDFVLKNQGMVDKTLLFDIELVRIQK